MILQAYGMSCSKPGFVRQERIVDVKLVDQHTSTVTESSLGITGPVPCSQINYFRDIKFQAKVNISFILGIDRPIHFFNFVYRLVIIAKEGNHEWYFIFQCGCGEL